MVPPGLVHVSAEIAPADSDEDGDFDEKYILFKGDGHAVRFCTSSLAHGLIAAAVPR